MRRRTRSTTRRTWQIDAAELELEKMIGKGACGEVHLARWRGQQVAVKLLKPSDDADKHEAEFFGE